MVANMVRVEKTEIICYYYLDPFIKNHGGLKGEGAHNGKTRPVSKKVQEGPRRFKNGTDLYMGFVALSLNQSMRKTSPQPEGEETSQGSTEVVPRRPEIREIGTGGIVLNHIGLD